MHLVSEQEIRALEVQCTPIDDIDWLFNTCEEMVEVCNKRNGIGLSAVQLGLPYNIFISKSSLDSNEFDFHIDCNYEPLNDEKIVDVEGCLTLPGRYFKVERYKTILFTGTMLWKPHKQLINFQRAVTGVESVILQHETDHAKGILISDTGVEVYLYR